MDHQPDANGIGFLPVPIWFTLSACELIGVVAGPLEGSLVHHLVDITPAILTAGVGYLHWHSLREYRKSKLKNEVLIKKLEMGIKCKSVCE